MIYKCPRCEHVFSRLSDIKRHIERKNLCNLIHNVIPTEENIIYEQEENQNCEYCNKVYCSARTLKKHQLNCKNKTKFLEDKVKTLEEVNKQLAKKEPSTIINDNSTTNNTVNNIIINITPYNDPNLEGAERYYKEAIKKIFMSVPTIIERIHFNTDLPENHNICITNYRSKLAKVFNGREWKTMDEDHLIDELVNTYENLLEDWADGDPNRMKYIDRYKEIKERDGADKVRRILRTK